MMEEDLTGNQPLISHWRAIFLPQADEFSAFWASGWAGKTKQAGKSLPSRRPLCGARSRSPALLLSSTRATRF
jgi:hypothetical protein